MLTPEQIAFLQCEVSAQFGRRWKIFEIGMVGGQTVVVNPDPDEGQADPITGRVCYRRNCPICRKLKRKNMRDTSAGWVEMFGTDAGKGEWVRI